MPHLNPVSGPTRVTQSETSAPAASGAPIALLPDPTASAFIGTDPLSQMMMALQKQADCSLAMGTTRIRDTQASLHEQLEAYLDKLKEICEKLAAAKADDDDGGWFSDCCDFVADIAGEILGTVADLAVDAITVPVELTVDVVKNFGDSAAMLQAMQSTAMKLVENGGVAEDVHGFTQGVVAFTTDLAELTARLSVDVAGAAVSGQSLSRATSGDLQKLWGSLKTNILDNPHFWAVAGAVAKGVAVAGAVMSGGALAPLAIGLMVLMEADQRTGFIQAAVGEKAALWVRLGVSVAASLCLIGGSSANSDVLKWLKLGTGVMQGAGGIYTGIRTIQSANERADQLEDQAELTSSLNRMQRLQRLLDSLLSSLDDDAKSNEQTKKLGADVMQAKVACEAALILPA